MLPSDRPVTGRDLEALRQKLDLLVNDFCFVLGISMAKWSRIKKSPDAPLDDPGLAILARVLDDDPSLSLVPKAPTPQAVHDKIVAHKPYSAMPRRAFGIVLGRDASASYRWLEQQQHTGTVTDRLLIVLAKVLDTKGLPGLEKWMTVVDTEASARKISNIWREGLWRQRQKKVAGAARAKRTKKA